MKKNVLIILGIVSVCNLFAQTRDYAYYNHHVDSLILDYSVNEIKGGGGYNFFTRNDNLSKEEKKKLITQIRKMFEQTEYTNLYALGHRLLYNMYMHLKDNPLEIRQMLMDLFLQYYFYPGWPYSIANSYNLESRFDYTVKAKKRIVEILDNKKTYEEYVLYFMHNRTIYTASTSGWDEAAVIMKKREVKNEAVLKQLRDSIIDEYVAKEAKKDFERKRIDAELIKMIGLLEIKECIPGLKRGFEYCMENECDFWEKRAYSYALARMGDKEQRQYMLDNLMIVGQFDKKDFLYFQDDEMIWRFIEVNYFSKEPYPILSDLDIPAYLKVMSDVYPYIKNVPKELGYRGLGPLKNDYEWAKALYEWLMENKDKIEFDYDGEKEFHW
jgi:hypothetical protein